MTWTDTTQGLLAEHLNAAPWEWGKPSVLIARTVKGHGLPFLEDRTASHHVTRRPATSTSTSASPRTR